MKHSKRLLLSWILALVALMLVSNEALAEALAVEATECAGRGWAYSPRSGLRDSDLRSHRKSDHHLWRTDGWLLE